MKIAIQIVKVDNFVDYLELFVDGCVCGCIYYFIQNFNSLSMKNAHKRVGRGDCREFGSFENTNQTIN